MGCGRTGGYVTLLEFLIGRTLITSEAWRALGWTRGFLRRRNLGLGRGHPDSRVPSGRPPAPLRATYRRQARFAPKEIMSTARAIP